MPRLCSRLLLSLLIASSASAVTMEWTSVGNPGNRPDTEVMTTDGTTGFGSVSYAYRIGTYEVTNAQYVEFLNAKGASDSLQLYNTNMGSGLGGITRSGSDGGYTYSAIAGRENMPVNWVSFYDALRFANWMNNGQGSGSTEIGAYTLLGGAATPTNESVARNAGAAIFLTSENEWYKAAYYNPSTSLYLDYPAGSNTQTACATPTPSGNRANCGNAVGDLAIKGRYTGSASPYGTFDQGGNVEEWNEGIPDPSCPECLPRGLRGGLYSFDASALAASFRDLSDPTNEYVFVGFRVAAIIPEPSTGLLVIAGLLGLAGWRRARA